MTSLRQMVEAQIIQRGIRNPAVIAAMLKVPREAFVPRALRYMANEDRPLPLSHGQTISQPYIVAAMTAALELKPTDRVLEIGTGCGYQCAVLAQIAAEVYSIEIIPALARQARQTLLDLGYNNIHIRLDDGTHGWPDAAPFDAIIATAAPESVPEPLLQQLGCGGKMVIPIGPAELVQDLVLFEKGNDGSLKRTSLMSVRFVPMTSR